MRAAFATLAALSSAASIAWWGAAPRRPNLNFLGNFAPEQANTIVCASGIEAKW